MANLKILFDQNPRLVAVMTALEKEGFQAHLVGGAVRNALLGEPVKDYDIATDARPEEVQATCAAAGFATYPTGIEHGTITVVEDDEPFEITTWRRDVATDGRRATVEYASTLVQDARRRDFTINALYAGRDGTVLDPTGQGLQDIARRRVRFIDDPATRIREDALRILRYFRFSATIAGSTDKASTDFQACSQLSHLVSHLSRERIGQEMRRILAQPRASRSFADMADAGLVPHVFPGQDLDATAISNDLIRLEGSEAAFGLQGDFLRRLALISDFTAREGLVLGRREVRRFSRLILSLDTALDPARAGFEHGEELGFDMLLIGAARRKMGLAPDTRELVRKAATSPLPLTFADLPEGLVGSEIGAALAKASTAWIASGFTASLDELRGAATA